MFLGILPRSAQASALQDTFNNGVLLTFTNGKDFANGCFPPGIFQPIWTSHKKNYLSNLTRSRRRAARPWGCEQNQGACSCWGFRSPVPYCSWSGSPQTHTDSSQGGLHGLQGEKRSPWGQLLTRNIESIFGHHKHLLQISATHTELTEKHQQTRLLRLTSHDVLGIRLCPLQASPHLW